tara:strand:+ start:9839 stop:11584 length:1746 start_codon:yes stop_codon:yes gene_type:complete
MKSLVFDIETDGITDVTVIWCISAVDLDSNDVYEFGPDQIDEGVSLLKSADKLIGHNIINYDIPWIRKLCGIDLSDKKLVDTLVISRLFNPVREGGHGLKQWGEAIGYSKVEYDDFSGFDEGMLERCTGDVILNKKVYYELRKEAAGFSKQSIDIENTVASILKEQEDHGFLLDQKTATILLAELQEEMDKVTSEVKKRFKPKVEKLEIFKRRTKTGAISRMGETLEGRGVRLTGEDFQEIKKKGSIIREKRIEFNLGSRKQIGEYLQEFGWKPKKFTPTGQPMVDEKILSNVKNIPEAVLIARYLMLQKRIAQVNSWFKELGKDGRVHGFVNHNGTVTGRMTHRNPNMAQVPNCSAPYGKECRACWVVPSNYKLVGIDASGLELRMLAHYMNDEGFIDEILNGDIHSANQRLAGLESRNQAKTFIYALIYGAGNEKLGSVVGGNKAHGKRLRESFLNNLPSFAALITKVSRAAQKGFLRGLDGRKIKVRSQHSALNALLQGGGAIVMKKALMIFHKEIQQYGAVVVGNIHDEWQVEVPWQYADAVGKAGVKAIIQAGEDLELRCPLDGEYKIGDNWSETH